jgi:hypothetical protein
MILLIDNYDSFTSTFSTSWAILARGWRSGETTP